ncbi:translation initiation factor eIF-2B subunit alpha [Cladochytrium tenue]|nr:translation initiation factor eIF-2B subunit alpha [Cladochytrium tenue]
MAPTVKELFDACVAQDPTMALPVAASAATTMSEFMENLTAASNALKSSSPINYSVIAGCESFLKFLNDTSHDVANLDICKERITQFGENFVLNAATYRDKIAAVGVHLIKDDAVILLHSYSRVVMLLLRHAASLNRRFKVIVTETMPSMNGKKAASELKRNGIPVCLIPDSAVGLIMEQVDMVLVGAEGVVESGGLINQLGTYQIAVVANASKKPIYSVTESYKFVRMFPLNQGDFLRKKLEFTTGTPDAGDEAVLTQFESDVNVDYTPPHLVSSFVTNMGVLTPSGVVQLLLQ